MYYCYIIYFNIANIANCLTLVPNPEGNEIWTDLADLPGTGIHYRIKVRVRVGIRVL